MEDILEILKTINTSLSSETDAYLNSMIGYASSIVDDSIFPSTDHQDYKLAVAYLTASNIFSSKTGSTQTENAGTGAGGLKSKKAGSVEVEYYQETTSSSSTSTTSSKDSYYPIYEMIINKYTVAAENATSSIQAPLIDFFFSE